MNLASFLLGTVFVPVAGIAWEFFPGIYLYKWFSIGTFNPGTWAATCLFAIFINTFVEKFIIEKLFKYKAGKKGFWWLVFVNTLSVSIAFISMLVFPQEI
jgi:formate hydrogenlyase subunit 3/multisubunit Na+/H+ antiporter MnhD subunit